MDDHEEQEDQEWLDCPCECCGSTEDVSMGLDGEATCFECFEANWL